MATEKAANLRNLSDAELERRLTELSEERFNLRFRNSMKQLENPLLIRENRRTIARVKTVLAERRRAAQAPAAK
ncbi:MAG: 50S ribosomal protein L29 [Candidatus Eisenbacteria bacterium]|uniref:Large ribosomal subunit protein uL29 n=1 Tax=Eiseniibacteriota bacterium TaxID=2212470 RepID=A0A956RNT5_UNCEI|nr:50S ribosomal protein L29 [Candidatus Eisenbacteria bacterium]